MPEVAEQKLMEDILKEPDPALKGEQLRERAELELEAEKDGKSVEDLDREIQKKVIDDKKTDEEIAKEKEADETKENEDEDEATDDEAAEGKDEDTDDGEPESKEKDDSEAGKDTKERTEDEIKQDVQEYADSNKMTFDEAKTELDSIEKQIKKYGGDVKQLAKANLYALRMQSRTQQELKTIKDEQSPQFDLSKQDHVMWNGQRLEKAALVESYKKQYPGMADKLENDDNAIFDHARQVMATKLDTEVKKQKSNVAEHAKEKRMLLINQVPDEDIQFIDYTRDFLKDTPDATIANEHFSIKGILDMARGEKYHEHGKTEYDRGYQEGLKKNKILKEKAEKPEGSNKTKAGDKTSGKKITLNDVQKEEARERYPTASTVQLSWELYQDDLELQKKRDEKKKEK